ncbi:Conserved_hypothetical protein [Hexamita inflata]|uniref:Uncharacterized protein n=1 Tax=Hexamita inflata TaxID=28002 RepID=A0AA86Q7T0_9EUKA|nr:Conserved hypothetical protein [Hexamita inflata]
MFCILLTLQATEIKEPKEFMKLSLNSDSMLEIDNDLDFTNITNFKPLQYAGIIDGKGHTIKNLLIDLTDSIPCTVEKAKNSCEISVGIFSFSSLLHVHNLAFDNVTVKYSNSKDEVTELNMGVLVGQGHDTKVVNVSVTNSNVVATNTAKAVIRIGGLVGDLEDFLVVNHSVLSVNLTLNGNQLSHAGGVVGSALTDNTNLVIYHCKVYVNITSAAVVYFGGATSYMQVGWVEFSTIDIDLNLMAENNIVGGFVVDEPANLTIKNCQNSISKQGGKNLSAGGICGMSWVSDAIWSINGLVTIFQLYIPPVYADVVNGSTVIKVEATYCWTLHETPIPVSYLPINRTQIGRTNKFNLDKKFWSFNETQEVPTRKETPQVIMGSLGPQSDDDDDDDKPKQKSNVIPMIIVSVIFFALGVIITAAICMIMKKKNRTKISAFNQPEHTVKQGEALRGDVMMM